MFAGTLTFAFALLREVGSDSVPDLGVTLAGLAVTVSLSCCSCSISTASCTACGPVAVAAAMAAAAGARGVRAPARPAPPPGDRRTWSPRAGRRRRCRVGRAGAIQAIDRAGAGRDGDAARLRLSCFRTRSATSSRAASVLIEVHGPARCRPRTAAGLVALGAERTIEQDPAFALRILVDIAIRALSPAVNDPTTAVQVLGRSRTSCCGSARAIARPGARCATPTGTPAC